MTKRDLILARNAACRDRGLSHGAARLFCVLVDVLYTGLIYCDEDEWEASESTIKDWLNCGLRQARAYRDELLKKRLIRFRRLKGCPPTHVFSFSQSIRNGRIDPSETDASIHPKGTDQSVRKGRPLTKYSCTGERVQKSGGERDAERPPAPVPKKAAGVWWKTPPQFEDFDRKIFPRERKALAKDWIEFANAQLEKLKAEFHGRELKDWPEAARATREAWLERRRDVNAWAAGVKR